MCIGELNKNIFYDHRKVFTIKNSDICIHSPTNQTMKAIQDFLHIEIWNIFPDFLFTYYKGQGQSFKGSGNTELYSLKINRI